MGASKTTKSTKILVLENFRLYGILITDHIYTLFYGQEIAETLHIRHSIISMDTRTCMRIVQMFRRKMPSTGDAIIIANCCKNEQSIHLVKAEDLPHTEIAMENCNCLRTLKQSACEGVLMYGNARFPQSPGTNKSIYYAHASTASFSYTRYSTTSWLVKINIL